MCGGGKLQDQNIKSSQPVILLGLLLLDDRDLPVDWELAIDSLLCEI